MQTILRRLIKSLKFLLHCTNCSLKPIASAVPVPLLPFTFRDGMVVEDRCQYVWEYVDMLPSLSYTPLMFMSLVCVHSLKALLWVVPLWVTFLSSWPQTAGQCNYTHHKTWKNNTKKIPMSPVQLKINVTSPPEENVCLLGNFVKSQQPKQKG